jgi:hypothetical protein
MLAYVFWHQPQNGVVPTDYEEGLRAFHDRLAVPSASFRIESLPFAQPGGGYEDWYLVEDWTELGELNVVALSGERRTPHDDVARLAAGGWAGIYLLVRGETRPPSSTRWVSKPAGQSYDAFLEAVSAPTIWQRQMTLGPTPEFCLVDGTAETASGNSPARSQVYPAGHSPS